MKKQLILTWCILPLMAYASDSLQHHYMQTHKSRFFKEIYYDIAKPLASEIRDFLFGLPRALMHEWVLSHPYDDTPASVRFTDSDELCDAEKQFTQKRLDRVKASCEKLLGISLSDDQVPRIALCCSGGGYRAMLLTFGFLKGLQDTGLLDCTTYMAGLSGSTWAMAPWIASQLPLNDYITELPNKTYKGLRPLNDHILIESLVKNLISKAINGQFLSIVDVSGATLANTLLTDFGRNRMNTTLTASHAHLVNADLPLPIYTAVTPNIEPYEWFEFTPFECGSSYYKAYIPTWAYGRKFKDGQSVNFAAEQTLGYMMGIYGSAFGIDVEDAVRHTRESLEAYGQHVPGPIRKAVEKMIIGLINSPVDDVRLAPSSLPNFAYKANSCPLNNDKTLTLIDAGIHFNLPFPPLMRDERKVDIIIVCDGSGDIMGCQNLKWAAEYMQSKGLAFPTIDYETADKQVVSVFKDDTNPNCPIVVYFPRIKNDAYSTHFDPEQCLHHGYCGTLNFTYNENQIQELMGLSEFAVKQYADVIVDVIHEVARR